MKSVHLVIPDLFLPASIAAEVSADLHLPAMQALLARGQCTTGQAVPLENYLFGLFGVESDEVAPVAPVSAAFDGLPAGCWLRADPLNLSLQRDQMLASSVSVSPAESVELCASLNEYFAGQGLDFFAPHSQRWYMRVSALPDISTRPLSAVLGGNVGPALATGKEAVRWNQLFNEIQMLLFAHPLNELREARGESTVNSLWLWGGGDMIPSFIKRYEHISSDDTFPEMIASASGTSFSSLSAPWDCNEDIGSRLLVCTALRTALQRGDLAAWRATLVELETGYAQPLYKALRNGTISQLQLDVPAEDEVKKYVLRRRDTWAFWRKTLPLAEYSPV